MHAREKVSGTIIKRRLLCGCKRIGEVIINVKFNSNIWIRDPDVWNPHACVNIAEICVVWFGNEHVVMYTHWTRSGWFEFEIPMANIVWPHCIRAWTHYSNWRWWVAFASHIYIYTPIYIIFYIFLYCVRVTLTLKDGRWMRWIRWSKDGKFEHYWPLDII